MRVTLRDVAREAGVDVSTASRALNGRPGISRRMCERILAVAARLNYRPNLMARGLITGKSSTIGLLVSDIRNPYMAELARAADDAAHRAGYDIVLCNSDLDPAKQMRYFLSLLDKRVGGVIMNSVAALSPQDRQRIASSRVPVVLLSRPPRGSGFSSVRCDNERGGYLAGAYLTGLGHTELAHLTSLVSHPNLQERWQGFARAAQTATGRRPILLRGPHNFRGGFEMARRLLEKHPEVTAIFAANDAVAFGAACALHSAGVRIPDDISLIGFDGVETAAVVHPPLTTVSQPIYEIGKAAVEIVIRQITGKESVAEHRIFDVQLIERESCRQRPRCAHES